MSSFKKFISGFIVASFLATTFAPQVAVIADEISDAEGDGSAVVEIVDDNSADQAAVAGF